MIGSSASPDSSQDFEDDGVRLTGPSAKNFLDHILYEAETFFKGGRVPPPPHEGRRGRYGDQVHRGVARNPGEGTQETGENELCQ